MDTQPFHSGFVAIVGRPNVGKSTLMNALIGEKVSIVSSKPQTTRNRIMGVAGGEDWQIVFLDTPGMHTPRTRLGEYMVKSIEDAMEGIDCLIVMADLTAIGHQDREIMKQMATKKVPRILVLNKMDLVEEKRVFETLAELASYEYDAMIPVSARTGSGLEELKKILKKTLPEGPRYFPEDMITDQPERLIIAEIIREKALLHLKDEVPHGIGVEIMRIEKKSETLTDVFATIYCERSSHKGIIIGKQGSMLRTIGTESRQDIETLMDTRINLKLWVKVREDWRNRISDLKTLGYE